jgi:3-hydroxyisobutyrate dehydrogenase
MQGQKHKVAFFGLGLMGLPMAGHLLKAGYRVTVYNRTKAKALPLVELGAVVAEDPRAALETSDVVISMLFDRPAFDQTIGPHKDLLQNKTVIQMSTLAPTDNEELHREFTKVDAKYIEAPVLGTNTVAQQAKLQVLVGSTEEEYHTYEKLLACFGRTRYIGPIPKASSIKLALNHIVVGQTAVFATSLALVTKSGLPTDTFLDIIRSSALHSPYFDLKYPLMRDRDFTAMNFDIAGVVKDMTLLRNFAVSTGIDVSVIDGLLKISEKAAKEYPNLDFAVIYNAINPPSSSSTSSSST